MPYRLLQALSPLYGDLTWRIPTQERILYLTFDDGPTPGITEQVLDLLAAHQAQATFFLVGTNLRDHRKLAQRTLAEGHRIGNHTWTHLDGWKTPREPYQAEITQTQALLTRMDCTAKWFRPPYGKLPLGLGRFLQAIGLRTAMWSGLGWDWDARYSPAQVLQHLKSATRSGAILVLHDSVKAAPRMLPALPQYLAWATAEGYQIRTLPQ